MHDLASVLHALFLCFFFNPQHLEYAYVHPAGARMYPPPLTRPPGTTLCSSFFTFFGLALAVTVFMAAWIAPTLSLLPFRSGVRARHAFIVDKHPAPPFYFLSLICAYDFLTFT